MDPGDQAKRREREHLTLSLSLSLYPIETDSRGGRQMTTHRLRLLIFFHSLSLCFSLFLPARPTASAGSLSQVFIYRVGRLKSVFSVRACKQESVSGSQNALPLGFSQRLVGHYQLHNSSQRQVEEENHLAEL